MGRMGLGTHKVSVVGVKRYEVEVAYACEVWRAVVVMVDMVI